MSKISKLTLVKKKNNNKKNRTIQKYLSLLNTFYFYKIIAE